MSAPQPEPTKARHRAWLSRLIGPWLRQSLARRLTVVYLLTTLFVVLILSGAVYLFATVYLDARMTSELAAQADFYVAYASQLAANESILAGLAPTVVTLFAPQVDLNVRFFAASDGRLLAATQDIGPQPSQVTLVELRYRSPTLFAQASRDLPGRRYAAREIVSGGQTIGVVEVSRSLYADQRLLASLRYILLGAVLIGALLSLWVSVLLARRLSRPILDMEGATRRIAAGELAEAAGIVTCPLTTGNAQSPSPDWRLPVPVPLIVFSHSFFFSWSGSERGPGIWPFEGALAEETPGTQARLGCPAPLL